MVEKPPLLPAWFAERMTDEWHYGLLTVTGHCFYIERIVSVKQDAAGELWLDVDLHETGLVGLQEIPHMKLVYSPTKGRTRATIKASHVVAAFELLDT